ncbi:MAG: CPBP family intramembrane metalloprotease [Acidimicrobiia bacterium]|nr:MAG: CPBP family intramembrane metalloprotease [Acidimicrobiia bacterium]
MTSLDRPTKAFLPNSTWTLWDVLVAFLAGVVGSIVVGSIVVGSGADPFAPLAFSLIFGGQALASFVVVWVISRRKGTGSLSADVGLVIRGRDWWGVPAGMGLQIAIALITAPLIIWLFPDGPPEQGVAEIAGQSETIVEQLAVFAAVAVGAPLIEEIIFRGMLLAALARRLSRWPSILLSAVIFAGVHLLDPNAIAVIPGLFLLGVALAWAAMRTGNLSLPIALHSGINLLAAISILYGSQLRDWANGQLDQIEGVISLFL